MSITPKCLERSVSHRSIDIAGSKLMSSSRSIDESRGFYDPEKAVETLKVGDVVYLLGEVEIVEEPGFLDLLDPHPHHASASLTPVCIQAEGMADTTVAVVPLRTGVRNNLMTLKLFRVEKCLYELSPSAALSKEVSKDYLERNRGSDVQYGDYIQLCHLHSQKYLSFSTDPSEALGSHKVLLGPRAGSSTLIQLRGQGKQGQSAHLLDPVELVARCEFLDYFLGVQSWKDHGKDCFELQASTEKFSWKFCEFSEYFGKKNEILLNTPFVLTHKALGLNLTFEGAPNATWNEEPVSPDHRNHQVTRGNPDTMIPVLMDNRFDHQCYWMFEDINEFEGGPVEAEKFYFLKHIYTMKYLTNSLMLVSDPKEAFRLKLLSGSEMKLFSGGTARIEDENGLTFEAEVDKLKQGSLCFVPTATQKISQKEKVELKLGHNTNEKSIFEVHQVKAISTFVMWTTGMLPVFHRYYAMLEGLPQPDPTDFESHVKEYENFSKLTDVVKNSMKEIANVINDTSEISERVRKKQFLSIGFKLHIIVIDIAKAMIMRLRLAAEADVMDGWEMASEEGISHYETIAVQMKKLFPAMMSLMNMIAKNNKMTCKVLSKMVVQISDMFPFAKKLVGSLLSEIYRMINPTQPGSYYKPLCDKLVTVTSNNIEEQTLYMSLIRDLSEENGAILLNSSNILFSLFVDPLRPAFFFRFLMKSNVPYIEFLPLHGDMTRDEMLKANPDIIQYVENVDECPCFSLHGLSTEATYIEYVSEAILLMNTLCSSENPQAIDTFRSAFGFDIRTLLSFIKDGRLHLSFRGAVLTLIDTILLDKLRKVPFTTRQSNLSFRLEEVVGRVEQEEQHFTHGKREEVFDVVQWCLNFWTRKDSGNDLFEYGTLSMLKFLLAVLGLTYTLINYHYATPNFVRAINPAILDLLISLFSAQSEFHADSVWIQKLSDVLATNFSQNNFSMIYSVRAVQDLAVRLVRLNLDMNLRAKIEQLLRVYYHHRDSHQWTAEEEREIAEEVKNVVNGNGNSAELSSRMVMMFTTGNKEPSSKPAVKGPQKAMIDVLMREPRIKEFLCSATLSDMQLDASTRQELLLLLYQILETNNALMRMLKSIDLIEETELIDRRKFLSEFSKDFSVVKDGKVIRERLIHDTDESERLRKLLEQLLCVLSIKTAKPILFKKTQNLARSYKLHHELVALITLLSSIPEKQYQTLLSLVSTALINFCYSNEINRNELLGIVSAQFFNLTTPQLPFLIQEISNFEHLPHIEAEHGLIYILQKCVQTGYEFLPGLQWIRAVISYRGNEGYKKDMQTLACFRILEHLRKLKLSLLCDSPDVGELILLLADCAHKNPVTIHHCRAMMSVRSILDAIKKARTPVMTRAWMCFLYDVYFSGDAERVSETILSEILFALMPWFDKVQSSIVVLQQLVQSGAYEQIWEESRPYQFPEQQQFAYEAQLWQMLSFGDPWQRNTGLLALLPKIVGKMPSPSHGLLRAYGFLYDKLLLLHSSLLDIGKTMQGYDADRFIRISQNCLNVLSHALNPPKIQPPLDTDPPTQETSCFNDHKKNLSEASTVLQTEDSVNKQTNSFGSTEADSLFHSFVTLAVGTIEGFSKDYHVAFKEMAIATHPMSLFQQKHISVSKRRELLRMLKLLNTKIGPNLKFMIFDLLDAVIRDIPDKPAISRVFIDSGLVEAAVSAIVEQPNFKLMKSAITFLNGLFDKQSAEFLLWFLDRMRITGAYLKLFSQLKAELDCSLDRILMRGSYPGIEQHLTAYERDIFSGLLMSGSPLADVFELAKDYSINLVRFMQLCCDNCNLAFQEFMNTQTTPESINRGSVNVVDTIANYFIIVSQYESLFTDDTEAQSTMVVCLEALLDFVTGPCVMNQNKLGTDVQLLLAINKVVKVSGAHKDEEAWVTMYSKTLDFLMTLFEGAPSQQVLDSLIQYIELGFLLSDMTDIYTRYIKGHEKDLLLESPNVPPIAFVGFKIAIVASVFQSYFPKHSDLMAFGAANIQKEAGATCDPRKFGVINGVPGECVAFFYSFIGYVEIARNGRIESHYFQIPFICKFLTEETREDMIMKVDRSSQQEKIESFLDMIAFSDVEMRHQQNLYRVAGLKYFSEGWQLYGWISFILIITINIIVLADTDLIDIADGVMDLSGADLTTMIINIVQIVGKCLCYAFFLVEYYPNITAEKGERHTLEFTDYSSIRHNESIYMAVEAGGLKGEAQSEVPSTCEKLHLLMKHPQIVYFMCYTILSIFCFWWRFLYPFLLFDILQHSPDLGNILKAITQNRKQLILILVFWVLILYVFSGVATFQFNTYYIADTSLFCETLWDCFVSTLHVGVRMGGGIGDALANIDLADSRYYARVVYDLLFFGVVNLIILNIIFGIIVDTFGELRDERSQMMEDVNQKCFVCGSARSEIERSGSGWSHHFLNEHSPFAYMALVKYVEAKEMNDCNGLEKFVKEKLLENDSSFFPSTSKTMQRQSEGN